MDAKRVFFLAGLPRTGSTVLGSILTENPLIHVTPTSPLCHLLMTVTQCFNTLNLQYTFDANATRARVFSGIIDAFHSPIDKPVIIDKNRNWPRYVPAIKEYISGQPKIICTIRPIAEIIASYLTLIEKDENNFVDKHLRQLKQPICHEARANLLWQVYLKDPYDSMVAGIENFPEHLLLVEYRDLVFNPEETMKKIYDFIGEDLYCAHDFQGIENRCPEMKDEAWGLKDLHTIRPALKKESVPPEQYLPREAISYFQQFDLSKRRHCLGGIQ